MGIRLKFRLSLLLFSLFFFAGTAVAGERLWEFEGNEALSGWRFERATPELKDGSIVIEDGSFPVIFSPGQLNIESGQSVFSFRMKTNKPGFATLSLYSAHTNFTYLLNFRVRATDEYREYRVYLGDLIPSGEIIYDFALKLPGNKLHTSIDSIGFHSPGKMELAGIFWDGFWWPEPIEVGTSNRVNAPVFGSLSMLTLLYCLIPLCAVAFIIAGRLRSTRFTRAMLFKALLIGFAVPAVLFTFRMDFNWLEVWRVDRAMLAHKSETERIRMINHGNYDSYFDFIDEVKKLVPAGELVRPAGRRVNAYDDHVARSVAYYLLPVRSSPEANYLWLYFDEVDSSITYDAALAALKKGDKVLVRGVRPIRLFGAEAALYEAASGMGGRGNR